MINIRKIKIKKDKYTEFQIPVSKESFFKIREKYHNNRVKKSLIDKKLLKKIFEIENDLDVEYTINNLLKVKNDLIFCFIPCTKKIYKI